MGVFSKIMNNKGHTAVGVDLDNESIRATAKKYELFERMQFVTAEIVQYVSNANKFYDLVLALEVIEHLESQHLFLNAISKIINKTGTLIISTPNVFSVEGLVGLFWSIKKGQKYVAWDKNHKKLFNSFEFVSAVKEHGFCVEKVIGYYYNSSDKLPVIKKHISLPFSSVSRYPINMFGFNIIIIATKK